MPNFKYKAMNENGEKIEGVYTAASKEGVMEMISINNYYPLKVEEIRKSDAIDLSFLERVKVKDISIFCRQFYTMLNAGAPINTCLQVLSQQLTNKKLRKATENIYDDVRKGDTFSEAMKNQGNVFPTLLVTMIAAGELTGNLDVIMLRMSTHFEKENKINNKVKTAMVYPAVLGILTVSIVAVLLTFVVPVFVNMFTSSGVELPSATKMLLNLSGAIRQNAILILVGIALTIYLVRHILKTDRGTLFAHGLRLRVPILKGLNEKIIVSRFTRTLSTVLYSGVTLIDSLSIVNEVVGNKIVEEKLNAAREQLMKGGGLASVMEETKVFPPMLISMLSIGEESGSIDEILNKTADFYDEELETQIQTFTSLLEPLMLIVMGGIVGFVMMAMLLPMFTMYNTVQ
jgi:type IV pilus assembly protein PilC